MEDTGSWFWSLAVVVGPILLGLVFAYVLIMNRKRRRDPALEQKREEATRAQYRNER